jgi:hypothetical protein
MEPDGNKIRAKIISEMDQISAKGKELTDTGMLEIESALARGAANNEVARIIVDVLEFARTSTPEQCAFFFGACTSLIAGIPSLFDTALKVSARDVTFTMAAIVAADIENGSKTIKSFMEEARNKGV